MTKVKVFSTPTCPWCKKVKEFLSEKNIEFEDLNVAADSDARNEMIEKSGQMGVPVVLIDDKVIVGFDRDEIASTLGITG